MTHRVAIVAFCVCAFARHAAAQRDEPLADPWRWTRFTVDAGLASSDVLELVETPRGRTWLATRRGLAWFDDFRWYTVSESLGLRGGIVTGLSPCGEGDVLAVVGFSLYRGNEKGFSPVRVQMRGEDVLIDGAIELEPGRLIVQGRLPSEVESWLFEVRPDSVKQLSLQGKFTGHPYTRLWKTRAGHVLITTDQGFFQWSGDGWQCLQKTATDWYTMRCPVENARGEGLGQTLNPAELAGVWGWGPGKELTRQADLGAGPIVAMDINDAGDVAAVFRSGGMKVRRGGAWIDVPPAPVRTQTVTFVKYASNGDLWIGTQDGLELCRLSSQRWTWWHTNAYDNRNVVNALLADRDGTIWVGTSAGVEHRSAAGIELEQFSSVDKATLAPVTGLAQDSEGGIWVSSGSGFGGSFRRINGAWRQYGPNEGLGAEHVHRIRRAKDGSLWFLGLGSLKHADVETGGGVFRWNGTGFAAWPPGGELAGRRVYDMAEGGDGALWFATLRGIARYQNGAWRWWRTAEGLKHPKVFSLALTEDGLLWFGHQGNGVGFINAAGEVHYEGVPPNLERTLVLDMEIDGNGALWIASSAGLFVRHGDSWHEISRRAGLENPSVWPVLPLSDRVLVGTDGSGTGTLRLEDADVVAPRIEIGHRLAVGSIMGMRWSVYPYRGAIPASAILTRYRVDNEPWSKWGVEREAELSDLSSGSHAFTVESQSPMPRADANAGRSQFDFVVPPPVLLRPRVAGPLALLAVTAAVLLIMLAARRRRHSAAQAASERQLQEILDNTPAVIYLKGLDGRYLLINRRYAALFHVNRDEVVGKTDFDIFPREVAEAFRRNDEQVIREKSPLLVEETAPHDDGQHTYISAKFPLYNDRGQHYATCGISTDITAGKEADRTMRRHALVFENIHDAVLLIGVDGLIADCNAAAERMFRHERGQLVGQSPEILNRPEDAGVISDSIRKSLKAFGRWEGEICFVRGDGAEGYTEAIVVPYYDATHQLLGSISVNREVTQRKQADREKTLLEAELRQSQKMEAVGRLAGGVAHDFNNLLQAIFGYSELARGTLPADHPSLTSIDMVERAARQARVVVNSLLTFSRKTPVQKAPSQMVKVVQQSIAFLRPLLSASIELQEQTHGAEDFWVIADEAQLRQMIVNLSINARDAMPQGGRLVIRLEPCPNDRAFGRLVVEDTGIGMTAEVRARLFEPFFTTKAEGQGTGLGMPIVQSIVVGHEGKLEVISEPGRGTSVTVDLPRCDRPKTVATPEPISPGTGKGEGVLIIEDDDHVRSILQSSLRSRGFEVFAAGDPEEGTALLTNLGERIRLVVLDQDLPGTGHLAPLYGRILASERLPVMLITGSAEPNWPWTPREHDQLLRKPFDMSEFLAAARAGIDGGRRAMETVA